MAADDASCPVCGKPLLGRDRFEQKCATCREREVLGALAVPSEEEAGEAAVVTCPSCGASLPSGGGACPECGERLPRRRVSAPRRVALAGVGVVLVVLAWAGVQWARRPTAPRRAAAAVPRPAAPATAAAPSTPTPEPPASRAHLVPRVREETTALLELLRRQDYERVIDNYLQPDQERFRRTALLLERILHGDARDGLVRWNALRIRLGEAKARERLRQAGGAHPDYTVAFLAHVARNPEASGSHRSAEDRARDLLRWHLAGLFGGLDLAHARVRDIEDPGEGPFTAVLACDGAPAEPRPSDDPRRIRWVKLPVGWVIRVALADRLEAVHQVLQRPTAP